jgi:hypothetical protein
MDHEDTITVPSHSLCTFPCEYPDTIQIGIDLTRPILTHSPAWAVSQLFRTSYRTGHPGAAQVANTTHPTIKEWTFGDDLSPAEKEFKSGQFYFAHEGFYLSEHPLSVQISPLKNARMI